MPEGVSWRLQVLLLEAGPPICHQVEEEEGEVTIRCLQELCRLVDPEGI